MARTVAAQRQEVRNFGTCLVFNGSTDIIGCGTGSSLNLTGNYTISAWVNARSLGENSGGRIVERLAGGLGFSFGIVSTTKLFVIHNATTINATAGTFPQKGWVHVTAVFNGSTVTFYQNAVALNSAAASAPTTVSTTFYIGNRSATDRTFDGSIDDVRVYNTNLTLAQIQQIYYQGTDPSSANLMGWWNFNEGSGTSATDSSGNANTGTITGATYSSNVVMIPRTTAGARTTAGERTVVT